MIEIDFTSYAGPVRATSRSAPVLAARLENGAPSDLSSSQREALTLVRVRADEVQAVQSERDRLAPAKTRAVREAVGGAWNAVHDGLHAASRLSGTERADTALRVLDSLFPFGVGFVLADAEGCWAESERHLERVDTEGFAPTIDGLLGPEFLTGLRAKHADLGNAIGVGSAPRAIPSSTALNVALKRFGQAVGRYARLMMAAVDEDNDESCRRFLRAVAPIDVHRANARSSDAADPSEPTGPAPSPTEPATPSEPTPVVPVVDSDSPFIDDPQS
jgi:hypothetical protein